MQTALYLIPVTLGETEIQNVIPDYNCKIIEEIKYFIVENIRSARRFLRVVSKKIDIDDLTFYELNEHTDIKTIGNYLDAIDAGKSIGVLSEAGCPAIADPGNAVVELAHKKNIRVIPLVGPNSIIMALMASGFNGQNFAFNGYLNAKSNERENDIRRLEQKCYKENQTQIFIEAPYRNVQMFESLLKICKPQTKLCVAIAITCENEFIKTKTIADWKKEKNLDFKKIPAIFAIFK